MSTHLEESLRRDFDRVQGLITKMTHLASRMLRDCVAAFEQKDRQQASLIILRDQLIDQMETEIDRLCLEFLVRHQPAGSHLRFAYAALQINFELERIGDYAESIARQIIKLIDLNCPIPAGLLTDIATTSIAMLDKAVTAFVRRDVDLAQVTAQIEEQVDVLRTQANNELLHLVQSNQIPLAALTPLMTIARRFERVSDQAKSICQDTIYICTGEYAKHSAAHVYRVLFVDEDHGCLSRAAAGIGRAFGRPDFKFASAGLAPRPLDPKALSFLNEKGISIDDQKRLPTPPEFHEYQLVIALSSSAMKQLPASSRKAVQLDWTPPHGSGDSGSADQGRQRCEAAYGFLANQISQLIQTLAGEEKTNL